MQPGVTGLSGNMKSIPSERKGKRQGRGQNKLEKGRLIQRGCTAEGDGDRDKIMEQRIVLLLVQDSSFSAGGVVALGAECSGSDLLEIRSSSAWTSVKPNLEPGTYMLFIENYCLHSVDNN